MSTNSPVLRRIAMGLVTTIAAVGCMTGSPGIVKNWSSDGRYEYDSNNLDESAGTVGFNKQNYRYHWYLMAADGTSYERIEYYISPARADVRPWYHEWHPSHRSHRGARVDGYTEEDGYDACTTNPRGGAEYGVIIRTTHPRGDQVERSK